MGKKDKYYVELERISDGEIIICTGDENQVNYLGKGLDKTQKTKSIRETISFIDAYTKQLEAIGYRITHKEK